MPCAAEQDSAGVGWLAVVVPRGGAAHGCTLRQGSGAGTKAVRRVAVHVVGPPVVASRRK